MRVDRAHTDFLKNEINKVDPSAEVYLFGSRTDEQKKGGDIDILILSEKKLSPVTMAKVKARFYQYFEERKIDMVNYTYDQPSVFKELVMEDAIRL